MLLLRRLIVKDLTGNILKKFINRLTVDAGMFTQISWVEVESPGLRKQISWVSTLGVDMYGSIETGNVYFLSKSIVPTKGE